MTAKSIFTVRISNYDPSHAFSRALCLLRAQRGPEERIPWQVKLKLHSVSFLQHENDPGRDEFVFEFEVTE